MRQRSVNLVNKLAYVGVSYFLSETEMIVSKKMLSENSEELKENMVVKEE